jgi:hypothetical protein
LTLAMLKDQWLEVHCKFFLLLSVGIKGGQRARYICVHKLIFVVFLKLRGVSMSDVKLYSLITFLIW